MINLEFINSIDVNIINIIERKIQSPMLDKIMPFISSLGGMVIWMLIAMVFIFTKKYRKYGIVLIITLAACVLIGDVLIKPIVQRIRPCNTYDELRMIISRPSSYSFPSGHSMRSFAAAMILFRANKKIGIPAFVLAFLTGFSRAYLYAHYFTDIILGALLGVFCAFCIYKLLIDNEKINKCLEERYSVLWC